MGVDQEHRFEACVYEDVWTRLTANVGRVYENLFVFRQTHFSQPLLRTATFDLIYFLERNESFGYF